MSQSLKRFVFISISWIAYTVFMMFPAHAAKSYWRVTSLNWQPYSAAEMINEGNSVQRLRYALKQQDIDLLVEFYPWKRAQHLAKEEGYIGYFPAWPEEVYDGFVTSPPIDWSEVAIVSTYDKEVIFENISQFFSSHTVGLVRTYTYPNEIEVAAKASPQNVSYTDNELLLLRKLMAGRHDAVITDPLVIQYLAEKHSLEGVKVVKVLFRKPLVIALRDSPQNQHAITVINELFMQKD